MNLLLDTHVFIWLLEDESRVPPDALRECENPENQLHLSIASVWEMQIKVAAGKLVFKRPLAEIVEQQKNENGISILPISLAHIWQLAKLPVHHNDPFDRMLVAQATADKLTLVTADRHMARYPVELLW
jgi:PIN domain nuclease of toxin-antitoxin system